MAFFTAMKFRPSFSFYHSKLKRASKSNHTIAVGTFQFSSNSKDFAPPNSIYEGTRKQFAKTGSFEQMNAFLKKMKLNGFKINNGTFLFIMKCYVRSELFDEAVDLVLNRMEQEFNAKPNITMYNNLLNLLVENRKLKLVELVFTEIQNKGLENTVTFNILIKYFCKTHQTKAALQLIDEMRKRNLSPDIITYNTIFESFIEEKNLESALNTKDKMLREGIEPSNRTLNIFVKGYCRTDRVEEAVVFVREEMLNGFEPNKFTFNVLITGLCQSGYLSEALKILDFMLDKGYGPNAVTYNTIIYHLCKKYNRIEEALIFIIEEILNGFEPDKFTFDILVTGLCQSSYLSEALEIFDFMLNKRYDPIVSTYNTLIIHLFEKHNGIEEVIRILKVMMDRDCLPDITTYNIIMDALCNADRVDEAIDLVGGLLNLKMEDTVADLMEMIMNKFGFEESEAGMINGFLKIGRFDEAIGSFGRILKVIRHEKGYYFKR